MIEVMQKNDLELDSKSNLRPIELDLNMMLVTGNNKNEKKKFWKC
jgi:hypothetical protein